VDVRFIAASNADLRARLGQHRFRPDLFYRLTVLHFTLPPLRQRRDDLPDLIAAILAQATGHTGHTVAVSAEASDVLCSYEWPGNIRELDHALRHALAGCNRIIRPEDLPPEIRANASRRAPRVESTAPRPEGAGHPADILRLLEECGGNRTETARRMGISRSTLWVKLKLLAAAEQIPAATPDRSRLGSDGRCAVQPRSNAVQTADRRPEGD
jgi:two-component system response regulator HydG